MDFVCGYKSFNENASPLFENSFSHAPSPYPEHLYSIRSGPSSLVNLPCCNSPACSMISNFSSDPYGETMINRNSRYHPYQPPCEPYMRTSHRKHDAYNFYPSVSSCSLINERRFDSHVNSYQNFRMPTSMYSGKYDVNSHFKPNSKRKRHRVSRNQPVMPNGNFSSQNINNINQINYDPNELLNPIPKQEVLMNVKQKNEQINFQSMNEPSYTAEKDLSRDDFIQMNTDNNFLIDNSNRTEGINSVPSATEQATVNSATFHTQNAPIINNFSNENEDISTDLIFGDAGISAVVNEIESKDIPDLTDCQVTHITMPENSIFNIQDIQQDNMEGKDLENYFFQPIFEGKDEKGEDIVILVGNSNTPLVDTVVTAQTSTNCHSSEIKDNPTTLDSAEKTITINSGTITESPVEDVKNGIGASTFSSHVDNYGAEETIITSKKKYFRSKKYNKEINESPNEKHAVLENPAKGERCTMNDFTSQPSTSREDGRTSLNTNQNMNPSNEKCNCRCQQSRFKHWLPKWKRRLLWKCNDSMTNMQKAYFKKFMKIVKRENEHMMVNQEFWKLYRIMVTQIGGNVMKTIYDILPIMIRNSEESEQRKNNAALTQDKTPLQVKFPPKTKKQNNYRN